MLAASRGRGPDAHAGRIAGARRAQASWARVSVNDRLRVIQRARHLIARRATALAALVRRDAADTLVAEILPLAEGCRFLENEAARLLAPVRPTAKRPFWLRHVSLEIRREPLGVVLVIGPSNYPLFLPGIQAIQALAAGNAVLLKPGRGGHEAASAIAELLGEAGLDPGLCSVLEEDIEGVHSSIEAGVDKVVLTGSYETGRMVGASLARTATPAVMELSGNDPVFVLPGADLDLVAKALHFGLSLNGGDTCIAPKHIYVARTIAGQLRDHLAVLYPQFPVTTFESPQEAAADAASTGYALGATVFGDARETAEMAGLIRAGVVVVNDMIVPTADPRLPFGGRGRSGYGATRGAEGLLDLTAIKAVAVRKGKFRPHLEERHPGDAELFRAFLAASHGGSLRERWQGWRDVIWAAMARRKD
jgi:acyl-CoA reductase-like NAD-dependent aldehyde dehydrogenase